MSVVIESVAPFIESYTVEASIEYEAENDKAEKDQIDQSNRFRSIDNIILGIASTPNETELPLIDDYEPYIIVPPPDRV